MKISSSSYHATRRHIINCKRSHLLPPATNFFTTFHDGYSRRAFSPLTYHRENFDAIRTTLASSLHHNALQRHPRKIPNLELPSRKFSSILSKYSDIHTTTTINSKVQERIPVPNSQKSSLPIRQIATTAIATSKPPHDSSAIDTPTDNDPNHSLPRTIDILKIRLSEIEHISRIRMLDKRDVHSLVWPLLAECADPSTLSSYSKNATEKYRNIHQRRQQQQQGSREQFIFKAKISMRLLELCLEGVEARRAIIWNWLEQCDSNMNDTIADGGGNNTIATDNNNDELYYDETTSMNSMKNNRNTNELENFSPTSMWREAPHPTKEMFNLALTSWKNVVESHSSSSSTFANNNHNKEMEAMTQMEQAAKESSSLLSLMEEEYSSDISFVRAFNSRVDSKKYALLADGAACPDVRNYSEVLGVWGRCIGGGAGKVLIPSATSTEGRRRYIRTQKSYGRNVNNSNDENGDDAKALFQNRIRLEASAMKAMMELIESMEEALYDSFEDDGGDASSSMQIGKIHRPPPDRICYNIILSSMSRQANPSLYEMRLILQRMMERVKYEMESEQHDDAYDGYDAMGNYTADKDARALSFFPDAFSYNALIEAHANRSIMFSTELPQMQQVGRQLRRQQPWKQNGVANQTCRDVVKRRFTASEEEAILAEQTLEEMRRLVTMPVRPNIWSYNAVIKSWIKSGSERGLERAQEILRALAQNVVNPKQARKKGSTIERISDWGSSLFSQIDRTVEQKDGIDSTAISRSQHSSNYNQPQNMTAIGMASHLNPQDRENRTMLEKERKISSQPVMNRLTIGFGSRMALMNAATRDRRNSNSNTHTDCSQKDQQISSHRARRGREDIPNDTTPQPIGPLLFIEPRALPNVMTFKLVIDELVRCGAPKSAETAEDLLHLMEDCNRANISETLPKSNATDVQDSLDLVYSIGVYNAVMNAWARVIKSTNDPRTAMYSAQRIESILRKMAENDPSTSDLPPSPTVTSFSIAIDAWAHVASISASKGDISGGQAAAKKAQAILDEFQHQRFDFCSISVSCFGSAIKAWSCLCGKFEEGKYAGRAEEVMHQMIDAWKSSRGISVSLDIIHINIVFDAWARELTAINPDRSRGSVASVVTNMQHTMRQIRECNDLEPDTSSFNHIIRACYAPWAARRHVGIDDTRSIAMGLAVETYMEMSKDGNTTHRPDAHTYAHMFKAIACLLPSDSLNADDSAEKLVLCKTIFESCCREGQLTKSAFWVISKLFRNKNEFLEFLLPQLIGYVEVSKDILLRLKDDSLYNFLPAEWSRHGRNYKSLNSHMR